MLIGHRVIAVPLGKYNIMAYQFTIGGIGLIIIIIKMI